MPRVSFSDFDDLWLPMPHRGWMLASDDEELSPYWCDGDREYTWGEPLHRIVGANNLSRAAIVYPNWRCVELE